MDAAIIIGTYMIVFFAGYGLRAYKSRRRRRRYFACNFPPDGTRAVGIRGEASGVRSDGADDEEQRGAAASSVLSRTRSPIWRRAMSAVTITISPFGSRARGRR